MTREGKDKTMEGSVDCADEYVLGLSGTETNVYEHDYYA